jgi:hypothetical protein
MTADVTFKIEQVVRDIAALYASDCVAQETTLAGGL